MPRPVISKKCKGDEPCLKEALSVCPVGVFGEKKGKVFVKNPDACIGCRACEAACENGEIVVID